MPETDLARARDGDPAAFERMVTPLLPGLFGFIRRRLGQGAEDAYQETLLAAWRAVGGFSGQSSLKTWLYAIAGYKCADALRKMSREPGTEEAGDALAEEPFEEKSLERMDLKAALAALKPEDQSLLYLVYAQGFSLREAAGSLGIPEGTAKSRLHTLRKRLKNSLGGGTDEP